jgi:hypothetical protein
MPAWLASWSASSTAISSMLRLKRLDFKTPRRRPRSRCRARKKRMSISRLPTQKPTSQLKPNPKRPCSWGTGKFLPSDKGGTPKKLSRNALIRSCYESMFHRFHGFSTKATGSCPQQDCSQFGWLRFSIKILTAALRLPRSFALDRPVLTIVI